jgi:hypothetical protein
MTKEAFRVAFAEANRTRGVMMDEFAAQEITRLQELLKQQADDILKDYPIEGYPV